MAAWLASDDAGWVTGQYIEASGGIRVGMIGKWILIFGVVLIVVGAVVWLVESLGLPLGRLPGDIRMRGEGWSFSFPIVTCIVVSIVLTVLLNLFCLVLSTMKQLRAILLLPGMVTVVIPATILYFTGTAIFATMEHRHRLRRSSSSSGWR